jgi:glutaredoxin
VSSRSLRQRRSFSQRPPCFEHGLATGPDGLCTLCKRSQSARPVEAVAPSVLARLGTSLLGVVALASVGVALSVALGLVEVNTLLPAALRFGSDANATRLQTTPPPPPAPKVAATLVEPKSAAELAAEQAAQQIAEQAHRLAAAAAEAELAKADQARHNSQESEQDRKRHEMIEADMAERAQKRAREGVSVVMYSTSWCPSCVAARDYMTKNEIAFTEHDIDKSPSARAIQRRLNPKGSIPTIDVEGAVLVGFSGESLEQMIDAAAKKRLP